jgi:hypothetical protein
MSAATAKDAATRFIGSSVRLGENGRAWTCVPGERIWPRPSVAVGDS